MEVGRPNELVWSICLGGRNLQNISDGDAVKEFIKNVNVLSCIRLSF